MRRLVPLLALAACSKVEPIETLAVNEASKALAAQAEVDEYCADGPLASMQDWCYSNAMGTVGESVNENPDLGVQAMRAREQVKAYCVQPDQAMKEWCNQTAVLTLRSEAPAVVAEEPEDDIPGQWKDFDESDCVNVGRMAYESMQADPALARPTVIYLAQGEDNRSFIEDRTARAAVKRPDRVREAELLELDVDALDKRQVVDVLAVLAIPPSVAAQEPEFVSLCAWDGSAEFTLCPSSNRAQVSGAGSNYGLWSMVASVTKKDACRNLTYALGVKTGENTYEQVYGWGSGGVKEPVHLSFVITSSSVACTGEL